MDKDKKKEPEEMLGVSCNATCCSGDKCVKPYSKGVYEIIHGLNLTITELCNLDNTESIRGSYKVA